VRLSAAHELGHNVEVLGQDVRLSESIYADD